jgi:hypothetical protein
VPSGALPDHSHNNQPVALLLLCLSSIMAKPSKAQRIKKQKLESKRLQVSFASLTPRAPVPEAGQNNGSSAPIEPALSLGVKLPSSSRDRMPARSFFFRDFAAADSDFERDFEAFATNFDTVRTPADSTDNADIRRRREGAATNGGAATTNCEGGDATLMICEEMPRNGVTTTMPRNGVTTTMPLNDGTTTMPRDDGTTTMYRDDGATMMYRDDGATTMPRDNGTITMQCNDGTTTMPCYDGTTTMPLDGGTMTMYRQDGAITMPRNDGATTMYRDDGATTISRDGGTITMPRNDGATTMPRDDGATMMYRDDGATTMPLDGVTTTMYRDDGTTTMPRDDGTTMIYRDDGATTMPRDDGATTMPRNGGTTTMPLDGVTTTMYRDDGTMTMPRDDGATTMSLDDDVTSPLRPRELLAQYDTNGTHNGNHQDHSVPLSPSALVDMIHRHPSCKEVIDAMMDDEKCMSYVHEHFSQHPPLATQATHNKVHVDWSKCTQPYPVDNDAFRVYSCGRRMGMPRSNHNANGSYLAKIYARNRVLKSILKAGNFEHQRCILLSLLSHPSVRNIASSIGVNMNEIRIGQHILKSTRKLVQRTTETTNINHRVSRSRRNVLKAIGLAMMSTPTKDGEGEYRNHSDKQKRPISIRQISKQLGFSKGSGLRTLIQAEIKRMEIANQNANGWVILDDDDPISKYSEELLDALESWMENNDLVSHSPSKGDLIIKRDRKGTIARHPTIGHPMLVQKMYLRGNPRTLHDHMINFFDLAFDNGIVIISESKIRQLLNTSCSHIRKMTERQKMMCGCETCIIVDGMQQSVNLFRKK